MADHLEMKGYTFDNRDEFLRQPIAEKILKLLDSDIEVSPLIIDGKWGTGKTEFCFKFKNLIEADESNDYKVGYINAFQADHTNEPLLTLIAEVASFYDKNDEKRSNFIKNSIPYLRLVSGIGIKALASLAFGKYGANIPDEFSEGVSNIEDGADSLIDQTLESMIKNQVEAEKNLSTLREALTEIASATPIILLIDELDRCRPDFAIMMLETIKHVFDVKNVQIILVTNAEQLKATIKHSYGSETDSHNYLYKFFKYQINLPTFTKDNEGNPLENNVTYFKTVVQESQVIPQEFKDNKFIYEVPTFINVGTLSLRNIEQIVRCIETLVVFEDKELSQYPIVEQILMVFLSYTYMMDETLLTQILDKNINTQVLFKFIKMKRLSLPNDYENLNKNPVESLLLLLLNNIANHNLIHINENDSSARYSAYNMLKGVLRKFHFIDEVAPYDSGYIKETSYVYSYIACAINNLLLFEIVN